MPKFTTPNTWLITGTSRGMGREMVEQLLRRGDTVIATLRNPDDLADLADHYGDALTTERLDVTDTAALREAVDRAFATHDRIDVVASNAGYGVFGTAEDLTDEQVDAMIATNLTASIQLARTAVGHLRRQGGGTLVQMSSMGGHLSFPGFSLYHVTKWGIEGFYDALAQEVEPFGIRTVLVAPGVVRTGFFDAAPRVPVSAPYVGGPADRPAPTLEEMVDSQEKTVAAILRAADAEDPPRRLVLGSDAWQLVTDALTDRLAEVTAQRENAATADLTTP
ncbi:SDR family oxidoreductase [Mycolicibacterium grossiae]|uniref:Short-chain dehydrogenase/reductase n=1 Tax=Mycolicibacterium grossiae TaxID=1552759 RepID=A0A1E8QAY9_9MYCO|nr:SDR family oxidoreductase [Mycolicibacterium grossiae]OFJ55240.1 short-chain dehydrogenase/reductase [Mycolicibacterium grossiae]QEM46159.1 SDR family oxidoreductase [Mycolicibacterium grossiae]